MQLKKALNRIESPRNFIFSINTDNDRNSKFVEVWMVWSMIVLPPHNERLCQAVFYDPSLASGKN